ncbi:MAG: SpoVA/SpoVAEb family sporulation membrane protein [Ruminococcus sp.]|nr:SpoVA/SpoVAEb family sporulation membrane protein [Ruminococcus sp.]
MNITPEMYDKMSRRASPKSRSAVNIPVAFGVGGSICALGQVITSLFTESGLERTEAAMWTSVILIGISVLLTGFGLYHKLAKHAGAGTLVPITGFSNAISSSAIEAKSEGFVLGVGAKIFTIAGPVILYGSTASVIFGLLYYLMSNVL